MSSFILISTENYNTYIYVTISRLPTLGKSNRLPNGKITWCLSTLLPQFFHHYFTQPLHVDAGDLLTNYTYEENTLYYTTTYFTKKILQHSHINLIKI